MKEIKPIAEMSEEEQRVFFSDEKQINNELKTLFGTKDSSELYYKSLESQIEGVRIFMRGLNSTIEKIGVDGVSIVSVPYSTPGYYDESITNSKYFIGWVVNTNFLVLPSIVISKYNPYFFDLLNKSYPFYPPIFNSVEPRITLEVLKRRHPKIEVENELIAEIEDPLSLFSLPKPSTIYRQCVVTPLVRRGMLAGSQYNPKDWTIPNGY